MVLTGENDTYRAYELPADAFKHTRNIPVFIDGWKLTFINSKDKLVFYKKMS